MKLKYLTSIVFIIPFLGLFFVNLFLTDLSSFIVSTANIICFGVLFIAVVDVLFMALKHLKVNLNSK